LPLAVLPVVKIEVGNFCSLPQKVVSFYLPVQPRLVKEVTLPLVERRLFKLQSREKSVFSMYLPVERSLPLQKNDRTLFSTCNLQIPSKKLNCSGSKVVIFDLCPAFRRKFLSTTLPEKWLFFLMMPRPNLRMVFLFSDAPAFLGAKWLGAPVL
jgi:hypothetical protein